jgi:hypothetical protein
MDEFSEALVLIQTLKQAYFPVVLMGSDYWRGLIEWMRETMLGKYNYISPEDMDVFTLADEPEAATKIIVDFRKAKGRSGLDLPSEMIKRRNHKSKRNNR